MPVENSTQEEQESYTVAKQIQMKGRQSFILSHIIVLMLLKITSKNFLSRIEGVLCRKLTFLYSHLALPVLVHTNEMDL